MPLKARLFLFSMVATTGFAQTFTDYPMSNTWPGLSTACVLALNTTVQCSNLLPLSAENNIPRLNAQDLASLCTSTCLTSLNSARTAIQSACTLATDVIPLDWGTYPATFLVDLFLYTYGLNCRRDATTTQFCDVLFMEWLNQPFDQLTADQECSDCMLGVSQLQLSSPFGYDDGSASVHSSLTSSCSKTGYAFTSPAPYVTPATSTTSASPTAALDPGCVRLYTIQAGDTCNSIAVSQNVSTFAVYGSSGFRDCASLPTGTKVCLLGQCVNYQVKAGDTCDGIIAAAGITVSPSMFVAWNTNINAVCSNLLGLAGDYICLSRPEGLPTPNRTLPSAAVPATATAWPTFVPTTTPQLPTAPGTLAGCSAYRNYVDTTEYDNFYQPQVRDYTEVSTHGYYVATVNDVTVDQLLSWNPSLNATDTSNCTLAAGYSYCPPLKACIAANSTLIPASTAASCDCYTVYSGYDNGFLNCTMLADEYNITVATLQSWNPWLAGSLSTCDTALFTGITGDDGRQICVDNGTWINIDERELHQLIILVEGIIYIDRDSPNHILEFPSVP
ncbi:hypothetical protein B0T22DRAFT_484813 [Podospora appendiculata]|uniref:LysM domain-containing protein n=1 Tax=Podospora appendiculata TaxID=314037 RepID=A0AAE0X1L5_9PEZI|nr:hypothetical protein B0T22DRAFT_484813 [Podospora appendiculata]